MHMRPHPRGSRGDEVPNTPQRGVLGGEADASAAPEVCSTAHEYSNKYLTIMQMKHHMKNALLLDVVVRRGLGKDLHSFTQTEHQMKSALLLTVIMQEIPAIVKLLVRRDKMLLT
eukprot:8156767-Karenia_brevis.AAC.1